MNFRHFTDSPTYNLCPIINKSVYENYNEFILWKVDLVEVNLAEVILY